MDNLKRKQKEERIYLRVTSSQKEVIEKAARVKHTSLTSFVLENSYTAARNVLAEQTHFSLNAEEWQSFRNALDAPPKEIPALRKLLTQPGLLDAQ